MHRTRKLFHRHLHGAGRGCGCFFGNGDGELAFLGSRLEGGRIGVIGEGEAADEAAIEPLNPVKMLVLFFLLLFAVSLNCEYIIVNGDLDVFFSHTGNVGFDQVLTVILTDINPGMPITHSQ